MKKLLLAIILCVTTVLTGSQAYSAATKKDVGNFRAPQLNIKTGESYYIKYSCKIKVNLVEYLKKKSRLTWNPITAATLVVAIVDGTADVKDGLIVPGQAINPKTVFSVAADRGVMATTQPNSCNGALIAQGSDHPKLAYLLKFRRQTLPSEISTTVSTVLALVGPIFKLVKDNTMADKDAENIEQVQAIVGEYNKYLALFTAEESTGDAPFLRVGKNILDTEAATFEVNVRKIKSFLLEDVPFTYDYMKLVNVNTSYNVANLHASCQYARLTLSEAGFSSPDDQAYIISRSLNASVINSLADIVKCLGPELVRSVVKNRHLYLRHLPDSLVASQATLDEIAQTVKRATFDEKVRTTLSVLANTAGASAMGVIPDDRAVDFAPVVEPNITVNDLSSGQILTPTKPDMRPELIKTRTDGTAATQFSKLLAAGFTRFGCYSVTRSEVPLDGSLDGAAAVMLAHRPATKDVPERTVALRMFFNGLKLARFDITDSWVEEAKKAYNKPGRLCPY